MKKRFLPFSLLLVIMILGQSVMADQAGHYVPRAKATATAESVISSMRVNQHTGMIDPAWMIEASQKASEMSSRSGGDIYWLSMGPSNMGGRTTSVLYNNQNTNEIYIGSMGGGVFYSWNKGITWHQVGDDLMVSCMAQAADGTIYVGTGDGMNAVDYNGMADLNYENSFIGTGLYMIKNKVMTRVPSTIPTVMDGVEDWSFINDVAVDGNMVIVATDKGLKYLAADKMNDPDAVWRYAKAGDEDITDAVMEVKVIGDNKLVASVDGMLYIGTLHDMQQRTASAAHVDEAGAMDTIPYAPAFYDIAVAPSDHNVIYASAINTDGNHKVIYISENQGQTWRVVVPGVNATNGHQLYEDRGLVNYGLFVNPENPYSVFVTGYNLWRIDRPTTDLDGYYIATKLSDGDNGSIFSNGYLHSGVNAMAFNPRDSKSAFVATDGGIFKAQADATLYLTFANCNRGYISTRCFNIAPSGNISRVVAGLMDHGPVLIEEDDALHTGSSAVPVYPVNDPSVYGSFSEDYHAGPCAVSTINPDVFFIVMRDGVIHRSESSGVDYDATNFTANQSFSFTGYRMPIALWECYNYENSVDSVWFKCKKDQHAGEVVKCYSNNGSYPFDYVLPYDLHFNVDSPQESDSILVKDPIASKFYVADGSALYYSMDALKFNKSSDWYKLTTLSTAASCITTSVDGDVVLVGTRDGKIIRVSNMLEAYSDVTTASAPVVSTIDLGVDGQCVTSIALSSDNKKMVVTLGNYGNDDYILYSGNAQADEPTFVSKQGTGLAKMPVYSSVFEMTTGDVLIGTEHGIYRTSKISASDVVWTPESTNMGDVPVMELKQQPFYAPDQLVPMVVDTTTVLLTRPGVNNQGVIYAATYGKGLFRCETYRLNSGNDVPEVAVVAAKQLEMYPNPVYDAAKVRFDLSQNASVSYQVYDMNGRMVMNKTLGSLVEGSHEINVSMDGLSTGSYVLRLNAGSQTSTVKFMVY